MNPKDIKDSKKMYKEQEKKEIVLIQKGNFFVKEIIFNKGTVVSFILTKKRNEAKVFYDLFFARKVSKQINCDVFIKEEIITKTISYKEAY